MKLRGLGNVLVLPSLAPDVSSMLGVLQFKLSNSLCNKTAYFYTFNKMYSTISVKTNALPGLSSSEDSQVFFFFHVSISSRKAIKKEAKNAVSDTASKGNLMELQIWQNQSDPFLGKSKELFHTSHHSQLSK